MFWEEMSYNKYDFTNRNRLVEEMYDEELDKEFEEKYGIDMIDWEN